MNWKVYRPVAEPFKVHGPEESLQYTIKEEQKEKVRKLTERKEYALSFEITELAQEVTDVRIVTIQRFPGEIQQELWLRQRTSRNKNQAQVKYLGVALESYVVISQIQIDMDRAHMVEQRVHIITIQPSFRGHPMVDGSLLVYKVKAKAKEMEMSKHGRLMELSLIHI